MTYYYSMKTVKRHLADLLASQARAINALDATLARLRGADADIAAIEAASRERAMIEFSWVTTRQGW